MVSTTINVRIDTELKTASEAVLKGLGLSTSTAVNVFLRQVVMHRGLPFDVRLGDPGTVVPASAEDGDE